MGMLGVTYIDGNTALTVPASTFSKLYNMNFKKCQSRHLNINTVHRAAENLLFAFTFYLLFHFRLFRLFIILSYCLFASAPVSGGPGGAEAGTLTVMMGGNPITVSRVKPLLENFSTNIVHFGDVGK